MSHWCVEEAPINPSLVAPWRAYASRVGGLRMIIVSKALIIEAALAVHKTCDGRVPCEAPLIKCESVSRVCLRYNLIAYVAFGPLGHDLAKRLCAESDDLPGPARAAE